MTESSNRKILLGVTGGIAAYRSAELARRLCEIDAEVRVVMTEGATQFITELTMQAVSGNPVRRQLFDSQAEAGMGHIELARWATQVIVAPASASFLARLSHGLANDLLSTICLATKSPVAVAPAMNQVMWENQATQDNLATLRNRGIAILGPDSGSQACGEVGPGRMLQTQEIVQRIIAAESGPMSGLNVLVTAGSTWEAMDPVRGITNRSSGRMGYSIVDAAAQAGATVTLVSGPVTDGTGQIPDANRFVKVDSAVDMLNAVKENLANQDIFISVAAVADYRPKMTKSEKIKKNQNGLSIQLVENPDILAEVKKTVPGIFAVGFAAETSNIISEGKRKLLSKRADLIAANSVKGQNSAIGSEQNSLQLIDRSGVTTIETAPKRQVAEQLIAEISQRFHAKDRLQNTR